MAEPQKEVGVLEDTVVTINRCTAVTKGGKSLSFSALVVVGDRQGNVGFGFGKAREVPSAVSKATKDAKRGLARVALKGDTIPYEVWGRYGAARVFLKPAAPGTGIKAGAAVRAVVELAGIRNILTKCYGSRNPLNIVKATMEGLKSLRDPRYVARLRGVDLE
ncbi:MAG: 30S ribosomal protein S5 [Candidatus Brocadiales bacterium]